MTIAVIQVRKGGLPPLVVDGAAATARYMARAEVAAVSAEADATIAGDAASLAQIASLTAPNVYSTKSAGLAAVANGATFWSDENYPLALYRHVGGTAVFLSSFALSDTYENLADVAAKIVPASTTLIRVAGTTTLGDSGADMGLVGDDAVDAAYVAANPTTSVRDLAGRGFRRAPQPSDALTYASTITSAIATTQQEVNRRVVHVMDFVTAAHKASLDAGGRPDLTYAYNAATQATVAWSAALEYSIIAPRQTHKVNGTIYVREGQELNGNNTYMDCSDNTDVYRIRMGQGLIGGVPTSDSVGDPRTCVRNFKAIGGSAAKGFIYCPVQGFTISDVFLTACGVGIEFNGAADGLISNIEIDQTLVGFSISASQNLIFSTTNMYLPNYGVIFKDNCRDISFGGFAAAYTQFNTVYFDDSVSNIKRIIFSAAIFTQNVQYSTFDGFIRSRASNVEAQFVGCSFSNMRSYAVNQDAGSGGIYTFTGCVFDGSRSTTAYTASTTAAGVSTRNGNTYNFYGCEWRNLLGEMVRVVDGATVHIDGGYVANCPVGRLTFSITTGTCPDLTITDVVGFGFVSNTAGAQAIVLPWWGPQTAWEVAFKGSMAATTSGNYAAYEKSVVSVFWQFDGTNTKVFYDKALIAKSPNRAIPRDVSLAVCDGSAPGGATSVTTGTPATNGLMCVSAPITAANAGSSRWSVSTIC